jgi:hypothetical protein
VQLPDARLPHDVCGIGLRNASCTIDKGFEQKTSSFLLRLINERENARRRKTAKGRDYILLKEKLVF